jgi:hypothetical protein
MKPPLFSTLAHRRALPGRVSCIEALESRVAPATLSFAQNYASGVNTGVPVGQDAAGNVFVAGTFDGSIDLDPTSGVTLLQTAEANTNGAAGSDMYIAKYSPAGALLWAKSWGGIPSGGLGTPSVQEIPRDLLVDPAGDVYVLAEFDTASAGIGGTGPINSKGGIDTVVLKLSGANGAPVGSFGIQGMLQFGGSGDDFAGRLGLDAIDGLYITGSYDSPNARLNTTGPFFAPTGDEVYVLKVSATDGSTFTPFGQNGLLHFGSAGPDRAGRPLVTETEIFIEAYEGNQGYVTKVASNSGVPFTFFGTNGRLDIADLGGVALDKSGRLLATGGDAILGGFLQRYLPSTGAPDTSFDVDGNLDLGGTQQFGQSIVVDAFDNIYVAGQTKLNPGTVSKYFLDRVLDTGAFDPNFGTGGRLNFATTGGDTHREISLSIDSAGYLAIRGFFTGKTDLDPTAGTKSATSAVPSLNAGHLSLDTFTLRLDPTGVDAANPFIYTDPSGDVVSIKVAGAGSLRVTPGTTPGVDIERIETVGTTSMTNLKIGLIRGSTGTLTIASIVTPGANQDLGTVTLGKGVILGDGVAGGDPALKITGKATRIVLTDVQAYSTLDFGEGLAYLDTYTNQPNLSIVKILGEGVTIDVTGDGTSAGVGGGGLGRVVVGNWIGAGTIKTTQSVKSFWLKNGNCDVVFELDKDGVGALTKANIGYMLVPNGSWGSSGSEIEGNCGTFNCGSFLAGATLSAGSITSMLVRSGPYAGTLTLNDPSAAGMRTFRVNSDFTGYVDSMSSIRNIQVVGDFKGSLLAPSIGLINAFSFDGTTTGNLFGDPLRHEIIATAGSLGALKTTGGGIKNYEVVVFTTFGGFKVSTGTGTNVSTVGLDNVKVLAAAINSISVSLKPKIGAGVISLVGINNSVFESESTIGPITSTHAISGSTFAASTTMGNITVGSTLFPTQGVSTSKFLAGTYLGGDGLIDGDEVFVRSGKIGNITVKGTFLTTTIAAGIDPVDGIYGNANDVAAPGGTLPASQKAIGKLVLGTGSGVLTGLVGLTHSFVVEGNKLAGLSIGGTTISIGGALPAYLRIGGAEAATDVLLRVI